MKIIRLTLAALFFMFGYIAIVIADFIDNDFTIEAFLAVARKMVSTAGYQLVKK